MLLYQVAQLWYYCCSYCCCCYQTKRIHNLKLINMSK